MYSLREKYGEWAVITGASSGLGEAFAKVLASEHINLILIARRIERLKSLALTLEKEFNIQVKAVQSDLTKENFLNSIIEQSGGIKANILINNAGSGTTGHFEKTDINSELNMLSLNCTAPVILTRHYIEYMAQQKRGAVIFVGSVVGAMPNPLMSTYAATKAFNNILGSALWYDQRKNNIDVLSIAPGGTRTEFHAKAHIKPGPFNVPPEHVVHTALRALGKKPFVVDGTINKIIYIVSRVIPLKLLLLASGWFSEKRKKVS